MQFWYKRNILKTSKGTSKNSAKGFTLSITFSAKKTHKQTFDSLLIF